MKFIIYVTLLSVNFINVYSVNVDSLLYLYKFETNINKQIELSNEISEYYLFENLDYIKARQLAFRAVKLSNAQKDYFNLYIANKNLANSFYFEGDYDSAMFYFNKSFKFSLKTNDSINVAAALNRLGIVARIKGDFDKSYYFLTKSINIYSKLNNDKGLADTYNNLAILSEFIQSDNYEGINYYKKALFYYKKIKDELGIAKLLNNISTYYFKIGKYDSALVYVKKAVKITKNLRDQKSLSSLYNNMGEDLLLVEKIDSALFCFDKSLEISQKLKLNNVQIFSYLGKAKVYESKNNINKAELFLRKALKINTDDINQKITIYGNLSNIFYKKNKADSSLKYYKKYVALKDSIFSEKMYNEINKMKKDFEIVKRDKKIALLKKDFLLKQTYNRLLISISIFLVLVLIFIIYFLRTKTKLLKQKEILHKQQKEIAQIEIEKKRKENKFLEETMKKQKEINLLQEKQFIKEIEHKNRELASVTMHILNKNNILSSIQSELGKIEIKDVNSKKTIKSIVKQIDNNINLDDDWEQFKLHFEQVNKDFFSNLTKNYPNLTKNDLKLCAYIRINLSSKEISQMLNITIAGVNKSRNRLRKKLNIEPDVNLTKFLMKF